MTVSMNRNQIAMIAAPIRPAIMPSKQVIALSDIVRDFMERGTLFLGNPYELLLLLLYVQQSVTYGVVLVVAVLPVVPEK